MDQWKEDCKNHINNLAKIGVVINDPYFNNSDPKNRNSCTARQAYADNLPKNSSTRPMIRGFNGFIER